MGRYRYRTAVLVGPWRDSFERAREDAVRSRQARVDPGSGGLVWLVPGTIDFSHDEKEVGRRPPGQGAD